MTEIKDFHWAAGFIDGEGCFSWAGGSPRMVVGQVEIELLDKLRALFGGKIYVEKRTYKGNARDINLWVACGKLAVSLMMTLYPLLSQRRQAKISEILSTWKSRCRLRNPMYRRQALCAKGHDLSRDSANVHIDGLGRRRCWICLRANWLAAADRKKLRHAGRYFDEALDH